MTHLKEAPHRFAAWALAALVMCSLSACVGEISMTGEEEALDPLGPDEQLTPPERAVDAVHLQMRRLTQRQYYNTLQALVGEDFEPETELPVDPIGIAELELADEAASTASTGTQSFARFAAAAEQAAAYAMVSRDVFLGCAPVDASDPCIETFLEGFLFRAFRRPVADEELAAYARIVEVGTMGGLGLDESLAFSIASILQSPSVIYRLPGVPDGEGRVDDFSFATRLAFFLTDHPPDLQLLEHARSGDLDGAVLESEVNRMLETVDSSYAFLHHLEEVYAIGHMANIAKDADTFPGLSEAFASDAATQVDRMAWRAIQPDSDFMQFYDQAPIFDEDVTLDALLDVYGDSPRGGLFSTIGFLAMNSTPVRTSVTRRGHYIRTRVLCGEVPPPPPNVSDVVPAPNPDAITARERSEAHREVAACAGCHNMMDPLGLTLEHFDAIGQYRQNEEVTIDGVDYVAELDVSGAVDDTPVNGAGELGGAVAQSEAARRCVAELLLRRAFGGEVEWTHEDLISELDETFSSFGGSFRELVRATVLSPEFRTVAEFQTAAESPTTAEEEQ